MVLKLDLVTDSVLKASQTQGELRPKLLESHPLLVFENVTVAPEEDEVTLVVQRDNLAGLELGLLREQGLEQPASGFAQPRAEVVQNEFRDVVGCTAVPVQVLRQNQTANAEIKGWSAGKVDKCDAIDFLFILIHDN